MHTISRNETTFLRNTISSLRFRVHTFEALLEDERDLRWHFLALLFFIDLRGSCRARRSALLKQRWKWSSTRNFNFPSLRSLLYYPEKCAFVQPLPTIQFKQIAPTFLCIRISPKIPKSEFPRFQIPCIVNLEFLCYRSKQELSIGFEVNSMHRVSTFLDSICLALSETETFDSTLEQKFLRTYNFSEKFPASKFSSCWILFAKFEISRNFRFLSKQIALLWM